MVSLSAPVQMLLGADAAAHCGTMTRNSTPQVSVVWVLVQGDEILFGADTHRQKAINLRRDSNVVLSIENTERNERGFHRHLSIRGAAVERVTVDRISDDGAWIEESNFV